MTLRIDQENLTRNYEHFRIGVCTIDPNQFSLSFERGQISRYVMLCESEESFCNYNSTTGVTDTTENVLRFTTTFEMVTTEEPFVGPWLINTINITIDELIFPPSFYETGKRSVEIEVDDDRYYGNKRWPKLKN
jgi:hypothetical protein